MAEAAEQLTLPEIQFTGLSEDDIPEVLALGHQFFNESEYPPLTEYNAEGWSKVLQFYADTPDINPFTSQRGLKDL